MVSSFLEHDPHARAGKGTPSARGREGIRFPRLTLSRAGFPCKPPCLCFGRVEVLILGCGHLGARVARALRARGVHVRASVRSEAHALRLRALGVEAAAEADPVRLPRAWLRATTHLLDLIPPRGTRDAAVWADALVALCPRLRWAGVVSTTGIYGDHGGARVDETTQPRPSHPRALARLAAERRWRWAYPAVEVFRLAGLYDEERNLLPRLARGDYEVPRFVPPNPSHRVHTHDAVRALLVAMEKPQPGRVLNLADDDPTPHERYARALAQAAGLPAPRVIPAHEAARKWPARRWWFFQDRKRVDNRALKALVGGLVYPSFRAALPELVARFRGR